MSAWKCWVEHITIVLNTKYVLLKTSFEVTKMSSTVLLETECNIISDTVIEESVCSIGAQTDLKGCFVYNWLCWKSSRSFHAYYRI